LKLEIGSSHYSYLLENLQDTKWPGNDVKLAVDFLHELRADHPAKHSSRRQRAKYEKDIELDSRLASKTNALLALCHRSYWTRLWIIQELALGVRGTVQCGPISFDLVLFQKLCGYGLMWEAFCRRVDDNAAAKMFTSPTMKLVRLVDSLSPSTPLLEVMAGNPEAECGDVRDKAFGLLSLCSECCRIAIRPDYSQSLKEICEYILEHHIKRHTRTGESCRDIVTKDLFDAIGIRLWEIEPSYGIKRNLG
jgi:hypothetical protein